MASQCPGRQRHRERGLSQPYLYRGWGHNKGRKRATWISRGAAGIKSALNPGEEKERPTAEKEEIPPKLRRGRSERKKDTKGMTKFTGESEGGRGHRQATQEEKKEQTG